jgi:hypothetical protein
MDSGASEAELRELVRRYRVTLETRPEMGGANSTTAVGFIVELSATTEHAEDPSSPQCAECSQMAGALDRLARAAVAPDVRTASRTSPAQTAPEEQSTAGIQVGRGRLQVDPGHDARREMSAAITVLHSGDVNQPVGPAQRQRLAEIVERLRVLGIPERRWRDESDTERR